MVKWMMVERKKGRKEGINIKVFIAKSSTLYLKHIHIHGTALGKLLNRVLFIIFGDG